MLKENVYRICIVIPLFALDDLMPGYAGRKRPPPEKKQHLTMPSLAGQQKNAGRRSEQKKYVGTSPHTPFRKTTT